MFLSFNLYQEKFKENFSTKPKQDTKHKNPTQRDQNIIVTKIVNKGQSDQLHILNKIK